MLTLNLLRMWIKFYIWMSTPVLVILHLNEHTTTPVSVILHLNEHTTTPVPVILHLNAHTTSPVPVILHLNEHTAAPVLVIISHLNMRNPTSVLFIFRNLTNHTATLCRLFYFWISKQNKTKYKSLTRRVPEALKFLFINSNIFYLNQCRPFLLEFLRIKLKVLLGIQKLKY